LLMRPSKRPMTKAVCSWSCVCVCVRVCDRAYVAGIKRPFSVRYDPYTSSVEVLDNPLKIRGGLDSVKDDLKILTDALSALS